MEDSKLFINRHYLQPIGIRIPIFLQDWDHFTIQTETIQVKLEMTKKPSCNAIQHLVPFILFPALSVTLVWKSTGR